MELFRIKKDIPFMRHARIFNALSLVVFLLAVFFLVAGIALVGRVYRRHLGRSALPGKC